MKRPRQSFLAYSRVKLAWFAVIVAVAATTGMFAAWRAPRLNQYAQDQMMKTRGTLAEPTDIVIVAIDEASIAKYGQFPWRRSLAAQALDKLSATQPKVIALDILYSEPTNETDDRALVDAIKHAGNVVICEQLVEDRTSPELSRSVWLKDLSSIENSAAGVGHVNVETESDGTARELMMRLADDDGTPHWALAVETVRVADALNEDDLAETNRFVRIGTRRIPFTRIDRELKLRSLDPASKMTVVEPMRMPIDFVGPSGSFAAQTVSFADVLDGKVSPERFRGKYVLIGATAATMGDRIATPFVHTENAEGDQHGDLTPGVEILANSINTILGERFYRVPGDWTVLILAALVAMAVIFLTGLAEGRFEPAKQLAFLGSLFALILVGSYLAFTRGFIIAPVVPMLASFAVATPLALLRRSMAASSDLDERIEELAAAGKQLLSPVKPERQSFGDKSNDSEQQTSLGRKILPRGLEWKTEKLGSLSRDLIDRSLFVDSALRSLEEGLIIADPAGRITFANKTAAAILGVSEINLIGQDLFTRLTDAESGDAAISFKDNSLADLVHDQGTVEREIVIENGTRNYYVLRISTVLGDDDSETGALGFIATLSDVSEHRELEQTKNDVISLVTHELRTPLTAIQGMSELLTEHDVDDESRRKMLSTINAEAKRLARMVNDYLDIAKLESGARKVNFGLVNVEGVIDQTLLLLEPLALKRGIRIVRRFQDTLSGIEADQELLARAVTNLVANAVKYSPDNTSITVETGSNDNDFRIVVTDEGCGIPADHLHLIFDKFYRVPQRRTAEVSGTGLGLSLTQEIIDLHGGTISVTSEPQKGSAFTVLLPIHPRK